MLSKKPPHRALLSARPCATPHVNGPKFLWRLPGYLGRCAGTHRCPRRWEVSLQLLPSAPSSSPGGVTDTQRLPSGGTEQGTPPALQPPWAPLGIVTTLVVTTTVLLMWPKFAFTFD